MGNPGSDTFTSTLLVNNIHCPSCVSYAEDILRPLSDITKVTVSIVPQEIQLKHHRAQTALVAARRLGNAAFGIEHIQTSDSDGKIISSHEFRNKVSTRKLTYLWPFRSSVQRKHIENCRACQMERARQPKRGRFGRVLGRKDTSFDEERQDSIGPCVKEGDSEKSTTQEIGDDEQGAEEYLEYTASLSIGGMTCASCSGTIEKELNSLDFVTIVNINLMTNIGSVVYRRPKDNINKIVEAIEDTGYGVSISEIRPRLPERSSEGSTQQFVALLSIEGMTCGSCVGTVTSSLLDFPFVHEVNINLVRGSGNVEFEGKENIDAILQQIDNVGYDATVVEIESRANAHAEEAVSERTITISVEGMYCQHCPGKIMSALERAVGDLIIIEQPLTLKDPRIRIRYTPSPPNLTVRSIVNAVSNTEEPFSAKIWHPPTVEERSRIMQHHEQRRILARLTFTFLVAIPTLVIGVIYMSLVPESDPTKMWLEEPVWAGNVSRTEWALFIITTPVMFFGADVFHVRAFKELKALWRPSSRVPLLRRLYRFGSMNLLISAGTSVAYFSSVAVLIMDALSSPHHNMGSQSSTYFDSVTFLSFFILIGKFLEAYSKAKTGDAVAMLSKLRPGEALLVESAAKEGGNSTSEELQHVPVDLIEVGDMVKVLHGVSPPTDGIVTSVGTFLFDESSLTGESRPVKKVAGDQVFAGSINLSQPVSVKVSSIGGTSMLDKIVGVVREGQSKRAPVERIADTITGYFVPVITLLAITTFLVWFGLGQSGTIPARYLDNARGGWAFWSLEFAIAVFVVACPCGLGLAAPTALFVGGGLAARNGILVRGGGEAFQEASKLDVVVFDKTGTLTEGQMKVTSFEILDGGKEKGDEYALALTLSKVMEESSTHPIAKAIADYCSANDLKSAEIVQSHITEIPGQGMRGKFTIRQGQNEQKIEAAIGNQRLLFSLRDDQKMIECSNIYLETTLRKYQNLGQSTTILYLSQDDTVSKTSFSFQHVAIFAISDPIRSSAHSVISTLRDQHNLDIHICTGDNPTTALAIASQLGIPPINVRAGVLPIDKAAYINELQQPQMQSGKDHKAKRRVVAFVGDGTNDTPALTASDVSIALSSGSDIAVSSSSFIFLNPDLTAVLTLVSLAKRVFNRVKWNFVWAAVYNVLLVPVAAGVFFRLGDLDGEGKGWRLGPVWASLAMALSSVSVVVSSLALRLPNLSLSLRDWGRERRG